MAPKWKYDEEEGLQLLKSKEQRCLRRFINTDLHFTKRCGVHLLPLKPDLSPPCPQWKLETMAIIISLLSFAEDAINV